MAASIACRPPLVVVVTGVPGSGKTTLARQLAAELALPLLSLDRVKESLYDAPGGADRGAIELRLGAEAVVAGLLQDSPVGAVLDFWLDPDRADRERLRGMLPPGATVREVYCDVPAELAVQRYAHRVRHGPHRPPDEEVLRRIAADVGLMAEGSSAAPAGLGPVLRVDTARQVDVPEVVSWLTGSPAGG